MLLAQSGIELLLNGRVAGLEAQGFTKLGDGFGPPALAQEGVGIVDARRGIVGLQFYGG